MKIRSSEPARPAVKTSSAGPVSSKFAAGKGERARDYDAVFERTSGWTGADGAYSVKLTSGKVLWLFSDTLVGEVNAAGRRVLSERVPINVLGARAVHNSSAIQETSDPRSIRFVIRGGLETPRNLFDPPDGDGWFWVSAATPNKDGSATVLLNQFVVSQDPALAFGKQKAVWACTVREQGDEVVASGYRRIDSLGVMGSPETVFGAAVLEDGPWTYVYGARGGSQKALVMARVPKGQLADPDAYRFFDGKSWVDDVAKVASLPVSASNEFSVHKAGSRYVMTSNELSQPLTMRHAPSPMGPWSEPVPVFVPTEVVGDVFTYNAKAHPELTNEDGVLVTYNVNSFDIDQSLFEADVYRPRFVRVPLET